MVVSPKSVKTKNWTRARIKGALVARGKSLAGISLAAGLHRSAASAALTKPWPRVERLIAEAVGAATKDLWPHRYNAQGHPVSSQPHSTTGVKGGNVQSRRVA